jgi:hypothetical protein
MKYIKELSSFNNEKKSIYLTKDEKYGSYEGIIHYDINKIENWFLKRKIDFDKYREYIQIPVAFLNNINVNNRYRGKGYGNELYSDFENECYENDVNCIILESDSGESQKKGFILDDWYKSQEFEIIGNEGGNSIMIKKLTN